jgi:hypothetical protein
MKTMLLAAAVALTFGAGAAYAGEGEGPIPNTQFTETPNVIAQAPVYNTEAVASARSSAGTSLFVTQQHPVSVFPWNPNEGVGG